MGKMGTEPDYVSSFEFASSAGQACIHDERMRWRTRAAIINSGKAVNDEATHAWRVTA